MPIIAKSNIKIEGNGYKPSKVEVEAMLMLRKPPAGTTVVIHHVWPWADRMFVAVERRSSDGIEFSNELW